MIGIRERSLNVLLCHAYYQQRGGEDESFEATARLLEARGHRVTRFTIHNREAEEMPRWRAALRGFIGPRMAQRLYEAVRRSNADVVHGTNLFPLMPPSIYSAAHEAGAAVVQGIHNYRATCVNALMLRNGRSCKLCVGKGFAWRGIQHACYRESRLASAVVAMQFAAHRFFRSWHRHVDWFYSPSRFTKDALRASGIPANRFSVKPNFMEYDPGVGEGGGGYVAFVGRLSEEKGLRLLVEAWKMTPTAPEIRIAGTGPLERFIHEAAQADPRIKPVGRLTQQGVLDLVGRAEAIIVPSIFHEIFGRTVMEGLARGTPVLASRMGGIPELVEEGRTGFLFGVTDPREMSAALARCMALSSEERETMRRTARAAFLNRFTGDAAYDLLIGVYHRALAFFAGRKGQDSRIEKGWSPTVAWWNTEAVKAVPSAE